MATELNYELVSDACAKAILATREYREAAVISNSHVDYFRTLLQTRC